LKDKVWCLHKTAFFLISTFWLCEFE
jgi:hypothetical protein